MKLTVALAFPALALAQKSQEKSELIDRFANFLEGSAATLMRSAPSDMSAGDIQLKTRMSKLFARGVRAKYATDGLPDQAALVIDRNLGGANSSEYCDPDKGCNSPISLDGIWGYFKASYFDTKFQT